jgi:hypothetical protein
MPDDVSIETRLALLEQRMDLHERQYQALAAQLVAINQTVSNIDRQVSKAEGGWAVLLFLGTLLGGLTGIVGFFAGKSTGA